MCCFSCDARHQRIITFIIAQFPGKVKCICSIFPPRRFPPAAFPPRKAGTPSCGDGHIRAECPQPRPERRADPARAEHQHGQCVERHGELAQRDRNRALCGRDGIAQGERFVFRVICRNQSSCSKRTAEFCGHPSAQHRCAGTQMLRQLVKPQRRGRKQRRMQKFTVRCDRHRQQHRVGDILRRIGYGMRRQRF